MSLPIIDGQGYPQVELVKPGHSARAFFRRIHTIPLFLLSLSLRKRILIAMLSYALAIAGLWIVFPLLNNAASMALPIICLCWFFSYRGLLISFLSTASSIWVSIHYFLGGMLSIDRALVQRATLGFAFSVVLGLTICWLRKAIDLVQVARQRALTAEQERLLAVERERQANIGYEQQRKMNELKDQFLWHVNHELRTPLTVLGGSLELLKEFHETLDPLERTRMLEQALASQETLADLVNRVLETTSVVSEIPQAKLEAVCVHRVLQEVLAHLAPEVREAYIICLHVPEQIMVRADPHLLSQVVQQALSNIFKYVPRQTNVRIEAMQATPSSSVCLSIHDAGPGIPADELPLLFEKCVRLKRDLAGTTRGMGLGLYISKQLVEAMNGRIWVESSGRPGEGCRLCLTLPPDVA